MQSEPDIDWPQIAALYGQLIKLTGSPVVKLNHAVAVAQAGSAEAALQIVEHLALDDYAYLHSTRDLRDEVSRRKQTQDLVVAGSTSVVRTLMEHDLVDEYRLLVLPLVIGEGTRLFAGATAPIGLHLVSARTAGAAALLIYTQPKPA
ncbi:MAG: dihydrofolate reductase family protein [Micromonosporaceae bacterium]